MSAGVGRGWDGEHDVALCCVRVRKHYGREGVVMPNQTARQRARRAALDAQARMRERRAERERTLGALGVEVATALAERDAVIASCEARAGKALAKMTGDEGLTLRDALDWCGWDDLTVREVARLQQVAQDAAASGSGRRVDGETGTASTHATESERQSPPASGRDAAG